MASTLAASLLGALLCSGCLTRAHLSAEPTPRVYYDDLIAVEAAYQSAAEFVVYFEARLGDTTEAWRPLPNSESIRGKLYEVRLPRGGADSWEVGATDLPRVDAAPDSLPGFERLPVVDLRALSPRERHARMQQTAAASGAVLFLPFHTEDPLRPPLLAPTDADIDPSIDRGWSRDYRGIVFAIGGADSAAAAAHTPPSQAPQPSPPIRWCLVRPARQSDASARLAYRAKTVACVVGDVLLLPVYVVGGIILAPFIIFYPKPPGSEPAPA